MKFDKNYIEKEIDCKAFVFDSTDSTNVRAKELIKTNSNRFIVLADSQTDGRGRHGKSFFSPKSTGLYISIVFYPDYPLESSLFTTPAAAVAVVRSIEKLTELKPKIKWVNDIYLNGKKICGILTQSVTENGCLKAVIVGIGVNISTSVFPPEIKNNAGSLGENINRDELAVEIAKSVFELTADYNNKSFMKEYREKSCVIGEKIDFCENGEWHSAIALDIDLEGRLIVEYNGSEKILNAGEISLRI